MNGDLISRSALLRRVPVNRKDTGKTAWDWGILYMADIIKTIPAVDAVEVVRCKDCKHRGDDLCCPMCFEEESVIDEGDGYFDTDYITHDRTVDDGFCDRGERRADDAD